MQQEWRFLTRYMRPLRCWTNKASSGSRRRAQGSRCRGWWPWRRTWCPPRPRWRRSGSSTCTWRRCARRKPPAHLHLACQQTASHSQGLRGARRSRQACVSTARRTDRLRRSREHCTCLYDRTNATRRTALRGAICLAQVALVAGRKFVWMEPSCNSSWIHHAGASTHCDMPCPASTQHNVGSQLEACPLCGKVCPCLALKLQQ